MDESSLNKIITDSAIVNSGHYHKISDDSRTQKPYDGYGIINRKPAYIESKFIKNEIKSFNFNKIEPHQLKNLTIISEQLECKHYSLIALGLWKSREYFYVLFFEVKFINKLISLGKNSILKKELEEFIRLEKYLPVVTKIIDTEKYKIIELEKLDSVIIS